MSHFHIAFWCLLGLMLVPLLANILLGGPEIKGRFNSTVGQEERVSTAVFRYWLGGEGAKEFVPHTLHVAMQLAVVIGAVYLCRAMKVPDYMGIAAVALIVWRGK